MACSSRGDVHRSIRALFDVGAAAGLSDRFDALHAQGRTLVVITHEHEVAARAQRVVTMADGRVLSEVAA